MSNNSTTQLLIQFIDGELPAEDSIKLQQQIEATPELQVEFENLKLAKQAVRQYGLKNEVSAIHAEIMELRRRRPSQPGTIRRIFRISMRAAAILVLAFVSVAFYQYFTVSSDKLFNQQYSTFSLPQSRGQESIPQVEQAFRQNDYTKAITIFKSINDPSTGDYFFAGQSWLILHDPANAISAFETVISKNTGSNIPGWNEEAEYYLALSYLENKQPAAAIPLFNKIYEDKTHLYHDKVSLFFLYKLRLLNWKQ